MIPVGANQSIIVDGDKLMRVCWRQPYGLEELTVLKAASKLGQ